ncbi:MAG: nucleoside triphosphate pyrophosphohydrolase [Clostridia bacterium]|nr:nucleoside triphosphate pyrophosphohydrolase [Clostridia bacterium]
MSAILAKEEYDARDLVTIVELLRLPGGCPWDREQTHQTLRRDMIEETYEVIEAIDADDMTLLREELGDALLQIVLHARIEEEAGRATFDKIAGDVCRKMIHRHPHVFGDVKAESVGEVLANWETIKSEEKSRTTLTDKLTSIPKQFPALMRAAKVGKKAKALDFPDAAAVAQKLREELAEVEVALATGNENAVFEEMGDLLLSAASLARFAGVDPEHALSAATDKFISRFALVEELAIARGADIVSMSDAEKDILWQEAKKILKK